MAGITIDQIDGTGAASEAGDEAFPAWQANGTVQFDRPTLREFLGITEIAEEVDDSQPKRLPTRIVSANFSLVADDARRLVVANVSGITGTLNTGSTYGDGAQIAVRNTSSGTITIDPVDVVSIDGAAAGESMVLQADDAVTFTVRDTNSFVTILGAG